MRARLAPSASAPQLEHGLPPDGELPVPRRLAGGELDHTTLYMTVPEGAEPGTKIRVKTGINTWDFVDVPVHLKPGDVMQLDVSNKKGTQAEGGSGPDGNAKT